MNFDDYLNQQLKNDAELKKEFEALGPQYAKISARLKFREKVSLFLSGTLVVVVTLTPIALFVWAMATVFNSIMTLLMQLIK